MKHVLVLLSLGAFVLAGCGKRGEPGEDPLRAPADYVGAAARAKQVSGRTIDTVALNQAIQLFHASEGRYPHDLRELVTQRYLPRIPDAPQGMKIVYDAGTGQVRIVPDENP